MADAVIDFGSAARTFKERFNSKDVQKALSILDSLLSLLSVFKGIGPVAQVFHALLTPTNSMTPEVYLLVSALKDIREQIKRLEVTPTDPMLAYYTTKQNVLLDLLLAKL
jgi:hypothetical protein